MKLRVSISFSVRVYARTRWCRFTASSQQLASFWLQLQRASALSWRACANAAGRCSPRQEGKRTGQRLLSKISLICAAAVRVCVCESTGEERRANRGLFMYGSMLEKRP